MRKLHSIFWLPGDYSMVSPGSIVTVPHDPGVNDPLSGLTAAFLSERGLRIIVMLPIDSAALSNTENYATRLNELKATLAAKGITPWAISLGDEAFDACNNAMLSWPCFAGMARPSEDMAARKAWLFPRLSRLFTLTKQAFPTVPTMQVETMFCEDNANAGLWHPLCPDADIVAVDPYLWTDGCPWLGSGPLTPTTGADPKFGMEVAWLVAGTPAGHPLNISGAFGYGKPVVLVGQAFRDLAGQWRQLPTPAQSRWYFEWGVSQPQIIGLGWYAVSSVPGLSVGLDSLPEHLAMVRGCVAEMSVGTPVAAPVARPVAGSTPPPTAPAPKWTVAYRTDGSVEVRDTTGAVVFLGT